MRVDIITIFPEMFRGVLAESILRIAQEKGLLEVVLTDLRDYATDAHRSVDDRPYGGGPGMVMKVDVLVRAVRDVRSKAKPAGRLILMSPQGATMTQSVAAGLAREERLVIIAGHYEGYDERVREILEPEEVSIGDYVLTGGELPAMVLLDAVARLIPGVVGNAGSVEDESFTSRRLECPQYTRPEEFEGRVVPGVLRSGDHAKIAEWRSRASEERTRARRPDLLREARR